MQILLITFIAHILFTISDAYWLFLWLDMPVHFFMAAGLGIVFRNNFKWSRVVSLVAVVVIALGWEYVERLLGLAQALSETYQDAISDVILGIIGGIIGTVYAKRIRK